MAGIHINGIWLSIYDEEATKQRVEVANGAQLQTRVEIERLKRRSRAFRALNFSIRAISSTIFVFEFSIRAISSRKMVEHFDHRKISSDRRAISSIIFEKNFEQVRAFFEQNQAFFEHDRAVPAVNTNFWQILQ